MPAKTEGGGEHENLVTSMHPTAVPTSRAGGLNEFGGVDDTALPKMNPLALGMSWCV